MKRPAKSRRRAPRESRPNGRESVGFRRRREKRRRIEAFLAGKPLVAGIDLGSRTHAVWFTDRNLDPKDHFRIDHSLEGVAKLLQRADRSLQGEGFDRLIVFMETTAHYWKNVAAALERHAVTYRTVSPLAVDRKREIEHLTYAKGDFRDAELIARLGIEGHWLHRVLETEATWIELRALAREHEALLGLEVRERQRRRSILGLALPEFLQVFKDPTLKTASALLRALSTPAVGTLEEVIDRTTKLRGSRRLQLGKAAALVNLLKAGPSYGVSRSLRASFVRIGLSLERFDVISDQRTRVRVQLTDLLSRTDYAKCLLTIPGVDAANHALVLGFVGDPRLYDRGTCLAKLAGIEPRENHSDAGEGAHSISRRGVSELRHVLFRIVSGFANGNDEFATYLNRLTERTTNPLAYHQAVVAAGNKFLRLIHRLCMSKESYDPKKILAQTEPS